MFRRRFSDVVKRQFNLFEREYADLIRECDEAEEAYDRAEREHAEELYGDFMDLVEAGTDALAELRDNYARTLDEAAAQEYADTFNRAVLRRLPRFALEIEDV